MVVTRGPSIARKGKRFWQAFTASPEVQKLAKKLDVSVRKIYESSEDFRRLFPKAPDGSESIVAEAIERADEVVTIHADDNLKLRQVQELLRGYLVKRKVAPGAFDFQDPQKASGNSVRQMVAIKQGLDRELAKKIVKSIKGAKLKVQVAIQGDELRVSGKKRDDLQAAMALVKDMKLDQPLQYVNFRD